METKTRVRIYSLQEKGVSFSYATESKMIVVGGRYDSKNKEGLKYEMELMGFQYIDTLIVPSWDPFFCKQSELKDLLGDLLPDYIVYTDTMPINEIETASYDCVQNYCDGDTFDSNSIKFAEIHKGLFVNDQTEPFALYLNFGDIPVAYINQCRSEQEKRFIIDFFKNRKIDVLVGGMDFLDEGLSKDVIEVLNPKAVVGRISPSSKREKNNKILWVGTEDIFISKVNDEIVRLRLGSGLPEIISM